MVEAHHSNCLPFRLPAAEPRLVEMPLQLIQQKLFGSPAGVSDQLSGFEPAVLCTVLRRIEPVHSNLLER